MIWLKSIDNMNGRRLISEVLLGLFLEKLMAVIEMKVRLQKQHFILDGISLQIWAPQASLERIDAKDDLRPSSSRSGECFGTSNSANKQGKGDLRVVWLSHKSHRSGSNPDALLARKPSAWPPLFSHSACMLAGNNPAKVRDSGATQADETGKWGAAEQMAATLPASFQSANAAEKNDHTD